MRYKIPVEMILNIDIIYIKQPYRKLMRRRNTMPSLESLGPWALLAILMLVSWFMPKKAQQ